MDSDKLTISGYIVNNTFTIDYSVNDFDLAATVRFQEVGVSLTFSNLGIFPVFVGSFYLSVDSFTVLRFESTISQGLDNITASLLSQSYDV